jgi:transcriptional regulator with XRE-family HTH domain
VAEEILRTRICSEIARLLKEERLRQKLSLNLLSARARLNRQTVSFVEGEGRMPTVDTLLRISDALGIKLEDVIAKARRRALRQKRPAAT